MEKKEYKILEIKKDKKELRKNIGMVSLGVLVTGLGIVGIRYFGESFMARIHNNISFNTLVTSYGFGALTGASLLTSVGGGSLIAESIPKFKESVSKLKEHKRTLKLNNN